MQALIYYISLPWTYLISSLPFWFLYRLSDLMFIVVYYLMGYRKQVVFSNLKNSFIEKTDEQILKIQRDFYRYFCDLIVESIKNLTISPSTLRKRLIFKNLEVFQKYYDNEQSIIVMMGHWGNWELGGSRFAIDAPHRPYVIYHPQHNRYFDGLAKKMRSRLGNGLYTMKETFRGMIRNKEELTATVFIADQTPSNRDAYRMEFLNQDTLIYIGAGKIAKKLNYPVIYAGIERTRRGHYEIQLEVIVPDPQKMEATEIAAIFTKRLEQDIIKIPEAWLWSHRRWKHKRAV
jgi:Kdo2-lipid IVA lauroyltransferase/acyltransferase